MMERTQTLTLPIAGTGMARLWRAALPVAGLLGVMILFHMLSDGTFLTSRNLSNLSRQIATNLTLATGMTLVILTAGIDLSVGSVLALSGMVAAITQVHFGWSSLGALGALLSFACAIGVGAISGTFTGYAVSRLKITPFIVSLGMMVVCRGLTLIISSARAVSPVGESLGVLSSEYLPAGLSLVLFSVVAAGALVSQRSKLVDPAQRMTGLRNLAFAWLLCGGGALIFCGYRGIPYLVLVAMACAATGMLALNFTRFGRFIYAIGGNREAAELSGVPVNRVLWLTYLIMGALAGLAGVMDVSRVNGAVPNAGELAELDAIAAVVIGGTSLMGGVGRLSGTLVGVLIMGILNNGMSLIGVSEHYQKVFKGLVIILAVYLDMRSKKK